MTGASGIGSWPGTSIGEALRAVREILAVEGGTPYLPELPARGPGGDLIGRTAGLLVELPVDLQPSGWRLVDRPGRDIARTAALWREDLDQLAEVFAGDAGPLKLQVCGPLTLAAGVWLPRGERAVVDPGATRDLADSLAAGVVEHLSAVARLVPAAELVLQVDEPSLPAVLAGRLPTASGFGRLPAVDAPLVADLLGRVLGAGGAATAGEAGAARTVVHCCAADVPFAMLRQVGAGALAVDVSLLGPRGWESVAVGVEDGTSLWAGAIPTTPGPEDPSAAVTAARHLTDAWERIGMAADSLDDVVVTPACGLAGATATWSQAVARQRAAVETARRVSEAAHG